MLDGLLVIDVQQGLVCTPRAPVLGGEGPLDRICGLVGQARRAGVPVHFVLHDGGPGDPLDAGGPGFLPPPELKPRASEQVTIKVACDAFEDTDLAEALAAYGVDRLIVCGVQTGVCIYASVRTAVERGYEVVLVEDAAVSALVASAPGCALSPAAAIEFS